MTTITITRANILWTKDWIFLLEAERVDVGGSPSRNLPLDCSHYSVKYACATSSPGNPHQDSILILLMAERSFSVFAGVQRKQLKAQKS